MTPWLVHELRNLGLKVVCLDARQARAALKMQINKTDQDDAEGLAQIVRTGWYRAVHVKSYVNGEGHTYQAHRDGGGICFRAESLPNNRVVMPL